MFQFYDKRTEMKLSAPNKTCSGKGFSGSKDLDMITAVSFQRTCLTSLPVYKKLLFQMIILLNSVLTTIYCWTIKVTCTLNV